MLTQVLSAVIPLLSVLLGAGMTYLINIRTRRSNQVEDLFDAAIQATAVADASQHYLSGIGPPDGLPDQDYQAMMNAIIRTGIENHVKRTTEAREALARVVQYEPRVRKYYQDSVMTGDKPKEIMRLLEEGKAGAQIRFRPVGISRKARVVRKTDGSTAFRSIAGRTLH